MSKIFDIIYGLLGALISCGYLAAGSFVFYIIYGFFSSFTPEQWEFWFWVSILWPLIPLLAGILIAWKTSNNERNEMDYQLTEAQKEEIEEINAQLK